MLVRSQTVNWGERVVMITIRGNPFDVLGLSASAIEGLSDKDIRELAKRVAEAQLKIHNPRSGGDARRFEAIRMSLQALDNEKVFSISRDQHLENRDVQVAELQRQLRKLRVELNDLKRT